MPRAARICSQPGCPQIAGDEGRCAEHRAQRERADRAQRPTPAQQGYDWAWRKRRAAYLKRYPYCAACGTWATDVDHVIAKRNGGTDDDDNLESLCHACHSRKTAREVGWGGRRGTA
jgi:5-methylcytosine-specific restriction protein A